MAKRLAKPAVILFSGGLDSTTCLYYAKKKGFSPIALSFDYGQKHKIELKKAQKICQLANIEKHYILKLDFSLIKNSALTNNDIPVPLGGTHLGREEYIPPTYVPARNLLFLSYAIAIAENENVRDIFIGVNALDYSGYPDCRGDFIQSFRKTANLATKQGREGRKFTIHTPLLNLGKTEILQLALSLKVPIEETWSCYNPQKNHLGNYEPCGSCDACLLRLKAFASLKTN